MIKHIKIILIVILLVLLSVVGFAFAYLAGVPITHKGLKYAEKYRDMESVDYVYFTESDFGEYSDIQFQVRDVKGMFRSVGSMYTVEYSEEQYEKQLALVNNLDYLDETENKNESGSDIMPAVKIEKNGWTIRVLAASGDESYPKRFRMIGTKDESQTIVYMYFTDVDIDYISEESGEKAMEEFIEKYFNFKFD